MESLERLSTLISRPEPKLAMLFRKKAGYRGKRWFDLLSSLAIILLALPVIFPVLMLWIAIETGSNPFFAQIRNGFNNKPFRCLKFKTMIRDKNTNELIITKSGRWMRPLGIDELPQLFNILKGEMSLIGPRPHSLRDNKKFELIVADYHQRTKARPGMTGLAQSKGHKGVVRSEKDIRIRIKYDLQYIHAASFGLDLQIILATLKGIFNGNKKSVH